MKWHVRKGALLFSGRGQDGWTYTASEAKVFRSEAAANEKAADLRRFHAGITVDRIA